MKNTISIKGSWSTMYIPLEAIDSWSIAHDSMRLNFNRPLKLTGFKKNDFIVIRWHDKTSVIKQLQQYYKF